MKIDNFWLTQSNLLQWVQKPSFAYIKKNNTNHVVFSIIKSQNRLEWMVEKLTEIGIDEITFISTKNSERSNINYKRIDKKIISALKQFKSLFKPKINLE